jgi:hypothetical protein
MSKYKCIHLSLQSDRNISFGFVWGGSYGPNASLPMEQSFLKFNGCSVVKEIGCFTKLKGSLLCSKLGSIKPYTEPVGHSLTSHFSKILFHIIFVLGLLQHVTFKLWYVFLAPFLHLITSLVPKTEGGGVAYSV